MKKKVLDITKVECPMTFIKAKEFLKESKNSEKSILIKGKDNFQKLVNALDKNFFIETSIKKNSIYEIAIIKSKFSSPLK